MSEKIINQETGKCEGWVKQCPHCKKKFNTTSRRQKYCCSDCAKKHAKKLKEDRTRYEQIKPVERLRSRCHAIAVEVRRLQEELHIKEHKCDCCGATENLEVHHINLNWMDNTPSNLTLLCKKCHAKAHADLEKKISDEGLLVEEWYEKSTQPFMKISNKGCNR